MQSWENLRRVAPKIHLLPNVVLGDEESLGVFLPSVAHRPGQKLPLELLLILLLTQMCANYSMKK